MKLNILNLLRLTASILLLIPLSGIFYASIKEQAVYFYILKPSCHYFDQLLFFITNYKLNIFNHDTISQFFRDPCCFHITQVGFAGWISLLTLSLLSAIYYYILLKIANLFLEVVRGFKCYQLTLLNVIFISAVVAATIFKHEFNFGAKGIYDQWRGLNILPDFWYGMKNLACTNYFGFMAAILFIIKKTLDSTNKKSYK